jgi:hypothetical protein
MGGNQRLGGNQLALFFTPAKKMKAASVYKASAITYIRVKYFTEILLI